MQCNAREAQGAPPGAADAASVQPPWLSHLAHDLRGPLSPLANALTLLRSGRLDAAQQAQTCQLAQQQLELMCQLLDDTADLLALGPRGAAPVELGSLLDMAGVRVSRRLQAAGCELAVTPPASPLLVDGDMRGLLRLLTALLLRSADIAGTGARMTLQLATDNAPRLVLAVQSSEADAPARFAALAAVLTGSSQIHVYDAALARVIAAHDLRLEALANPQESGLVLQWP